MPKYVNGSCLSYHSEGLLIKKIPCIKKSILVKNIFFWSDYCTYGALIILVAIANTIHLKFLDFIISHAFDKDPYKQFVSDLNKIKRGGFR